MLARWIFPVAHLLFQLFVCLFLGGSFAFVVIALVFLLVVAYFEFRRRFSSLPRFRTLPELCAAPWACEVCAPALADLRRAA